MQRKNRQTETGRFSVRLCLFLAVSTCRTTDATITRVLRAIIRIKILDRASIRLSPSLQPDSGGSP